MTEVIVMDKNTQKYTKYSKTQYADSKVMFMFIFVSSTQNHESANKLGQGVLFIM